MTFIGIDLGGTKIAAAALDTGTGELLGRTVIATEAHEGPPAVLRRLAQVVERVCAEAGLRRSTIGAIGVGVPGVTDIAGGRTIFLPNLPTTWPDIPVAATLSEATGCPVALINDARAFILAEAIWGAGRGAQNVVGLTIGTGIGGGIVVDGQLYLGIDGTAGEIGHQTVDVDGPPCGCGNRGCLESFASGPAITAMGVKAVLQGMTTEIGALVEQDLNRITPETIMRAAERGDLVAREILARAGAYLGTGVANLATILSPNRVIIGGGVARLGHWLLDPVRETLRRRCFAVPVERIEVVPAALGNDAGIIGAAVWASQHIPLPA
ncbi:MAG: glucokinase [Gemmatimonadales bacterium]|jgi:glucokinase|nr:glucokinase [Gemmatimonadales bacterium]